MHTRFALGTALAALFAISCTTSPRMNKEEMFADMDPIELRTLSVGISRALLPGSKGGELLAVLYPREGAVSLEFTFSGNKNKLLLNKQAREGFIAALGEYLRLYEAHGLDREQKSSRPAFGIATAYHRWGVMTFNGEAYPKIVFSYTFEDSSPYFTVFIPRMPNAIYKGISGSRVKESFDVALYFTRAQATALAELLDQDFLVQVVEEKKKETVYGDGDEYVEKGEAAESGEAYTESGATPEPDYVEAE